MAGNASGFAQLDAMIASLRSMKTLARDAAPELAKRVKAALDANIDAGKSPTGETWAPKKDGGRPLVNASKAVTVTALGTVILIRLSGVEVFHHYGAGVPRRTIIPYGSMPFLLGNAIRLGFVEPFRKKARGR